MGNMLTKRQNNTILMYWFLNVMVVLFR